MKLQVLISVFAVPLSYFQRINPTVFTKILGDILVVCCCSLTPFRAWSANCVAPSAGLVAWWAGEGTASDQVGTNSGTLRGAAAFGPGKVGQGFDFNGSSGSILVPDVSSLHSSNAVTIDAWIYPKGYGGGGFPGEIVSKWYGDDNQKSYSTSLDASGHAYFLVCSDGLASAPGVDSTSVSTVNIAPLNQWSHFAATYDGATLRVYLNGVLENQLAWAQGVFPGTAPLVIGANYFNSVFNGLLDEISLYNRALSGAEIQQIYDAGSAGKCALPPVILTQPQSQTVELGNWVNFTAVLSGTPPLSCQWLLDGTNIPGATTATLTITNVQLTQAGTYSLQVTNTIGVTNSSGAVLVVKPSPCLTCPAGAVGWWPGEGASSDQAGTNNGTLQNGATYGPGKVGLAFMLNGASQYVQMPYNPQWAFGSNSFTIDLWASFANADGSRALLSSDQAYGAYNKWIFWLNGGLQLHINGANGTAWIGTAPFIPALNRWYHLAITRETSTYIFYINGSPVSTNYDSVSIPDSHSPLMIGQAEGDAFFNGMLDEVSIYNRALSGTDIAGIYSAGSAGKCAGPLITDQPQSQVGNLGQTVAFTVSAAGTAALSYQWQRNGTNLTDNSSISGASTSVLTLHAITLDDASGYNVIITNSSGGVASSVATLTVLAPPSITVQPQSQAIHEGSNVVFGVSVAAYPPVNYQWAFNGTNILGATGASLLVTNVQFNQSGSYSVAVTNSLGCEISTPAILTVLAPPQILSQPRSQIGYWGLGVSFQVHAVGTLPLSYQWYFEDFPIGWATNATLELQDLDLDAGGEYYVEVANLYGSAVSQTANLIVNPASVSPGIYFGLTITGAVGKRFGIQYVTNVNLTNNWTTITNITLAQPVQLWMDTSVNISASSQARRHYRAVAIP